MGEAAGSQDGEARTRALRALRHRDHTRASLDALLERGGVPLEARRETVDWACSLGYVDDRRFAVRRAETLAERGTGDLAIRLDLERHGVDAAMTAEAVAVLEPERDRAARIVQRRGVGPRTARHLARRGFCEDAIELAVADVQE